MEDMAISKDLKALIEANQNQLKTAIRNHQVLVAKLKEDPDNTDVQKDIQEAQQSIVIVGLEQKSIIDRLRKEYKAYQKTVKTNTTKNGVEERRFNLTNALNRARKQNIITRSTSATSFSASDESQSSSSPSTPEPVVNPINPYDISQCEFLNYFGLATHDVYKEMQNRRAERKRRSTANPQFLYTRGWDLTSKRKRNIYLAQNVSPPNTRQAVRNKNKTDRGAISPKTNSRPSSPAEPPKKVLAPFPTIPNLPSGLTIERVPPTGRHGTSDSKQCVECRLPGTLITCESCSNGFHLSCHNRPFVQTPRQCPRCLSNKETRTVGSLNVPSGMSVSYVSPEITDKLHEKNLLLEKNKTLTAELTQLQDRHSQLTISLKNQKTEREELLMTQQSTEDKIKQILTFITSVKGKQQQQHQAQQGDLEEEDDEDDDDEEDIEKEQDS
ncbi:phd finger protein [Holotrichia oblita]|uniref:Phd finger protein n=1 Tax=Holotrichia oblita TaxID=644536 RepID=A0ACB9T716_HOLOL|nr:phd finger protein [Holotrichia oblita]